jgi:RNA polymerase sigma-70 factor, ECF subfamily
MQQNYAEFSKSIVSVSDSRQPGRELTRLYSRMESTTSSEALTLHAQVAAELDDFDKVIQTHWTHIFRFALVSVRDRDVAQTITQDCFLKGYRARVSFRGDASVRTWLLRIAVNLIRDYGRNQTLQFWKRAALSSVRPKAIEAWTVEKEASPEERTLLQERIEAVWRSTEILTARQREIFLLRFVEELDLTEIASVTGLTLGSVKTHLHRAVGALRQRLGDKHAPNL